MKKIPTWLTDRYVVDDETSCWLWTGSTFSTGIRTFLEHAGWEGIVFHHPDGRMAKIKGRDFGLKR